MPEEPGKLTCEMPASNMKRAIADILVDEGYIEKVGYRDDGKPGYLEADIEGITANKPVITGIKRISKPGLRVYADVEHLPRRNKTVSVSRSSRPQRA